MEDGDIAFCTIINVFIGSGQSLYYLRQALARSQVLTVHCSRARSTTGKTLTVGVRQQRHSTLAACGTYREDWE